jgi:hypothetical protein
MKTILRTTSMLVATQKRKLGFGLHRVVQRSCPGGAGRVAVLVGLLAVTVAVAAPITPGNLLVYRVDGSGAALGADAAVVHIDEYAISGSPLSASLVQTITFPFTGPGPLLTGTGIGTSAGGITEGKLTISPNGRWVGVAGYNAPENTANVATASGINRTIGRIDTTDGSIDVSTSGQLTSGVRNTRAAVFDDTGTNIWAALHGSGTNFGLMYLTLGQTNQGTMLTASPHSVRGVRIFDGQLYIYSDSGNIGVSQVGSGLPTTGSQPLTGLPGISGPLGPSGVYDQIYGFFMADLDASVPGYDTLWMARETIGVTKFSLVDGIWTPIDTNYPGYNVYHIDGWVNPDRSVTLAIIGGAAVNNRLAVMIDSSGYNQPMEGFFEILVRAGDNNRYGGLVFVVPPPAAPPPPFVLINPNRVGNVFSVSFASESGVTYTLQYKNDLTDPTWTNGASVAGDGTVKTLSDTSAQSARFYRVVAN